MHSRLWSLVAGLYNLSLKGESYERPGGLD
jgi:hypothetical protein